MSNQKSPPSPGPSSPSLSAALRRTACGAWDIFLEGRQARRLRWQASQARPLPARLEDASGSLTLQLAAAALVVLGVGLVLPLAVEGLGAPAAQFLGRNFSGAALAAGLAGATALWLGRWVFRLLRRLGQSVRRAHQRGLDLEHGRVLPHRW